MTPKTPDYRGDYKGDYTRWIPARAVVTSFINRVRNLNSAPFDYGSQTPRCSRVVVTPRAAGIRRFAALGLLTTSLDYQKENIENKGWLKVYARASSRSSLAIAP